VPVVTRRRTLLGLSCVLVVAICALVVVVYTESGSDPEPNEFTSDPNIEYPEALSELMFWPGALATDASNGDLWFLAGTPDGMANQLVRYSASEGTLQRRTAPASAGLYASMAVDSRGHVILAQGGFVLDVDPAGGHVEYEPSPGGYFTDVALSDDGKAYVSKEYVAVIIEIDLRTGDITDTRSPNRCRWCNTSRWPAIGCG
jgi:hypothetical protein